MKKSSIADFFKTQPQVLNSVTCPACGMSLIKAKLNDHLDSLCSSATTVSSPVKSILKDLSVKKKTPSPRSTTSDKRIKTVKSFSNRLSLKKQKSMKANTFFSKVSKKSKVESDPENDDVIIVEEIFTTPIKNEDSIKRLESVETVRENNIASAYHYSRSTDTDRVSLKKRKKGDGFKKLNEAHTKQMFSIDKPLFKTSKSKILPQDSTEGVNCLVEFDEFSLKRQKYCDKFQEINELKAKSVISSNEVKPKMQMSPKDYNVAVNSTKANNDALVVPNKTITERNVFCPSNSKYFDKVPQKKAKPVFSSKKVPKILKKPLRSKTISAENNVGINDSSNDNVLKNLKSKMLLEKPTEIINDVLNMVNTSINEHENSSSCDNSNVSKSVEASLKRKKILDRKTEKTEANTISSTEEIISVESKHFSENSTETINDVLKDAKSVFANDSVFSELSDNNDTVQEEKVSYTPYYLANFKYILETVFNEADNQVLFNDEDGRFIEAFWQSSEAAQKLYVRLFQRKYKWLRVSKINYPDISNDPLKILEELSTSGLVDSGASTIDLNTALDLLSLPETRSLAKHFNFTSGKNKSEITQLLLKHCKEHKSVFFTSGSNGISSMMLKKVKQLIGPCYRISLLPKRLFTRVLMLFSLPTISEDDDEAAGGQQQQLLTLLQVKKGELVFPEYKMKKEIPIFIDRNELIRYEEARQLENDLINAAESKNYELAKEIYINAKEIYEDQCLCSFAERASSLPPFLKRYTPFHVYIRCMTQGVEALQKLRQYKEAVDLLKNLIKQKAFCLDYRGRWYDRLALNLEQHLKQPQQALASIEKALKDENVRKGHRYSLLTRALRITKSLDENDELRKKLLEDASVIEAPKVTIKGRLCPRTILGRRNVFISSSSTALDEDDVTVLGVEQLAIEHYKENGFTEGIHGEGSTFISLYALLFWDIIYDDDIPDVFISPHQIHPLDLNSEAFFQTREKQIMSHLEVLRHSSIEELEVIVKNTWENHHGKASLVTWDRFTDLEHVLGLVRCFGSKTLSGICERLAKDFRFTRSGIPDLVVWNPETMKVKVVEVKGPGDKLSSKQILWLDHLLRLEADAEVCLVEAVASKMLRK